jgi:sigma-B regulation protein RsbU (phosphoserine phosphatase)
MVPASRDAASFGVLRRLAILAPLPANAAGAVAVYLYFSYMDPIGRGPAATSPGALALFATVTLVLLCVASVLGSRWSAEVRRWGDRIRRGDSPRSVPPAIRRRVLNAALMQGLLSLAAWFVAGLVYVLTLPIVYGIAWLQAVRVFLGIVLVGGPVASALAFLLSEYHWRCEIPLFFPDDDLERTGVLRLPIRTRLLVTFLLTSILPLLLMIVVDPALEQRLPEWAWQELMRTQLFLVAITGVASILMALASARAASSPSSSATAWWPCSAGRCDHSRTTAGARCAQRSRCSGRW